MDQYGYNPAVVPVPNDEPTPNSSNDNDDELPPLAPALTELTLSIPSIPSFPKAVEDAFDSFCVADVQFDVLCLCLCLAGSTDPLLLCPLHTDDLSLRSLRTDTYGYGARKLY
jgi:hypothetical protein